MDPLKPSIALLVKLGSIIVHLEEFMSPKRHEFDLHALQTLTGDAEVSEWLKAMDDLAFLPKKR